MTFDGGISIIIGPNGGGRTNLLDVVVTMMRRYLIATPYLEQVNYGNGRMLWQLIPNQQLTSLTLERHASAPDKAQLIQLTVEVSKSDIENMRRIKSGAPEIKAAQRREYSVDPWSEVANWDIELIVPKMHLMYECRDGDLVAPIDKAASFFLQYLQIFEFDNASRYELKKESLQLPLIYLPVNRASAGFQSRVTLASFSDRDQKRIFDVTNSRSGAANVVALAIGRLGKRYRMLELDDNTSVRTAFYNDPQLLSLTKILEDLGYGWELTTVNPDNNEYDITLTKHSTAFVAGAASSGEREILTYLFAIYALNVRDAVIVVDEPELHLHPRWQKILFNLFERLSQETGNQFVLATHSPTFVSPASISYVSRVYIENQQSRIVRLNATGLPNSKHLFNIVNSQNNERLFFCDKVVLVEGLHDRIFFEKVLSFLKKDNGKKILEIVSVGGKYLFDAYRRLLEACRIDYVLIADLDYIEQIGSDDLKTLFRVDASEIRKDVIDNVGSMDGQALVAAIDTALLSGDWANAKELWSYIKARRIKRKPEISKDEQKSLDIFLQEQAVSGVYILSKGALECYLPAGLRGKNLQNLISFLEDSNFWEYLPSTNRVEIEKIILSIAS